MNKYKLTHGLLALALLAVPMISCTDSVMDDINVDKNHAQDVQAKFIVTDLITSTAFSTVGGDFSTYASVYIEQEAGIHNQLFNAETRNGEPSSTNTYNNVWSSTYTNLKNAKTVIAKCSGEGEEAGNQITLGIGQFFAAYNLAVLTDLFGDVPWTEACDMNISMQPKIDSQESIYSDIFKLIDDAISNFDGTDAMGAVGTNDLAYGGNGGKWKKAAYALKARLTMHLLNRASDKTASLNTVLDCISKSFESSSEELKFNFYDGVTNINPLFGFCFTRDALAASQSIVEKFVERTLLYDFYGELLTKRQQQIYESVVLEDYSLSEVAEELNISRQGVHDMIRRCDKALEGYEEKLHLVEKFVNIRGQVQKIHELASGYHADDIEAISNVILEEL